MLFPQCYSFHGMLQLHFLRSNKGSLMQWMVQKLHSKIFRCYDQQKGQFQVRLWNITIRKQNNKKHTCKRACLPRSIILNYSNVGLEFNAVADLNKNVYTNRLSEHCITQLKEKEKKQQQNLITM